jgi:hypothetical protein
VDCCEQVERFILWEGGAQLRSATNERERRKSKTEAEGERPNVDESFQSVTHFLLAESGSLCGLLACPFPTIDVEGYFCLERGGWGDGERGRIQSGRCCMRKESRDM